MSIPPALFTAIQTLEKLAAAFEHRLSGKRGSNKEAEEFSP